MRAVERLTCTDDEIVAAIADALGTEPDAYIQELVVAATGMSKFPPMKGNRKVNLKYARQVLQWIGAGQGLFADMPEPFLPFLFGLKQDGPVNSPERLEALVRPAQSEYAIFTAWLANLQASCEWIIQEKIGEHGRAGYQQERAAVAAARLCERFGRTLAWSSPLSSYRIVTGLLYEAMTGEPDRDLERACKTIADRMTQTEKRC
jgi:hypothetical protein